MDVDMCYSCRLLQFNDYHADDNDKIMLMMVIFNATMLNTTLVYFLFTIIDVFRLCFLSVFGFLI